MLPLWFAFWLAPTFYNDVQPILQSRCQSCHRAGEIGPMPLTTYREVRPWAKAIRESVKLRKMPPWFAEHSSTKLGNDPRLTAAEIAIIDAWVQSGAPEGNATQASPPPARTTGFRPDLSVTMPQAVNVPDKGQIDYQYIILPLGQREDRWVQAAEIRPGDRRAVHHAVAYIREPGSDWLRDAPSGKPFVRPGVTRNDILAIYAPGQQPMRYRPGMAKKIPAGSDVVLQIHYTPMGTAVADRTSIGLIWSTETPQYRVHTLQIGTTDFAIPPGEPSHRVTASGTLPNDALLLSMFPHMHLRGKAFEYSIVEPFETLLRVAPYDFYWQLNYELAEPRLLKKGTRLRCTAWFDNSPNNPRNPDPAKEVGYGEQSDDEMMVGFFDVAVPANVDKPSFFIR
jgi:hypothetical protein